MRIAVFSICILSFCLYDTHTGADSGIPMITSRNDLDHYVGKVVTIKGEVTHTKIATKFGG